MNKLSTDSDLTLCSFEDALEALKLKQSEMKTGEGLLLIIGEALSFPAGAISVHYPKLKIYLLPDWASKTDAWWVTYNDSWSIGMGSPGA